MVKLSLYGGRIEHVMFNEPLTSTSAGVFV